MVRNLLCVLLIVLVGCEEPEPPVLPEPPPTPPATQPTTVPATQPAGPATYMDAVREVLPELPTEALLDEPLPLANAAVATLHRPVLIDAVGCLWVTHPDGRSLSDIATDADAWIATEFVVDAQVLYTRNVRRGDERFVEAITTDSNGYRWHHATGSAAFAIGVEPDFSRAVPSGDSVVVPTDAGATVIELVDEPEDVKQYRRRFGQEASSQRPDADGRVIVMNWSADDTGQTQLLPAADGVLAWRTGAAVAYFDGSAWQPLAEADGWSSDAVHFVPYGDGSVLQIEADATLTLLQLATKPADREAIERLVEELSQMDNTRRLAASAQLEAMGPSAVPVLEVLRPTVKRLAGREIDRLIGGTLDEPTLGGMYTMPGPVEVASRLENGGVILRFVEGVEVQEVAGVGVVKKPGYVVIQPGQRIGLLPDRLRIEAESGGKLLSFGGDFVSLQDDLPPSLWGVNHFQPLLSKDAGEIDAIIGRDNRGRWLFTRDGQSLLVDPRLPRANAEPDIWVISTGPAGPLGVPGTAGRGPDGYPAMRLGGVWRLAGEAWETLDDEAAIANRAEVPGSTVLSDGRIARVDGSDLVIGEMRVPLEGRSGSQDVWLVPDDQGRVFVLDRPGRLTRFNADGSATNFDELLPPRPARLAWMDPAGRLCVAFGDDTVAVLWVDGFVPPAIRRIMPSQGVRQPPTPRGA